MIRKRSLYLLVLIILTLGLGLTGGILLSQRALAFQDPAPTSTADNFKLIEEAWATIQKNYVDRTAISQTQMTYGAISGMVDSLGDTGHSTFLTPEMVTQEHNFTQGEFDGIGALMEMKNGHATVVAPFDGSPAQKAGLKPGDYIVKVDGQDVSGLSLNQVVTKILGPAGTQVSLTIADPQTGETRQVSITRARIQVNNVTWQMLPGTTIAQVRIAGFSQDVTKELQKALEDAQAGGATGIILDLRNNPGGLLNEAIGVASQFLSKGNVMLEKNAQGDVKPLGVQRGGVAPNIPVVVLINGGTASASEIVAGALQDAKRAKLIGETTFGTGTVLNEFKLSDGSAMLLATEEWLTPNGRTIWHKGISPDITVKLPTDVSPLIPEAERNMTTEQLQQSGDAQLLRAIETLKSQAGSRQSAQAPALPQEPAAPLDPAIQKNSQPAPSWLALPPEWFRQASPIA